MRCRASADARRFQPRGVCYPLVLILLASVGTIRSLPADDLDLHGYLALQGRYFPEEPLSAIQADQDASISTRWEGRWRWRDAELEVVPFARLDSVDSKRTHFDLRELSMRFPAAGWDWHLGIGTVFWGVSEVRNLVDVVNQTDQVENIDQSAKLGQPMVHATRTTDRGAIELFMLPGFRERTYPGETGRLYLPIDVEHPVYQSPKERRHIDWAARWSNSLGAWDLGLGYFYGTRRNPRLEPHPVTGLAIPHYDLIHQVSLDLQAALGDWVWKLETFYRDTPLDDYPALVGGFEYTLYSVFSTSKDLGLIAEYLYDGRENTLETSFQNDLFVGFRLDFNDPDGTEVQAGLDIDLEHDSLFWRVEAGRRLGRQWRLDLELQGFPRTEPGEPIHFWRNDSYLQLELRRYF